MLVFTSPKLLTVGRYVGIFWGRGGETLYASTENKKARMKNKKKYWTKLLKKFRLEIFKQVIHITTNSLNNGLIFKFLFRMINLN